MVLEKDGEDQVDRSREKWSVTQNQGGQEYPTYKQLKRKTDNWIGHILRRNCFLKEGKIKGRLEWQQEEEEDVSSYFMALRNIVDTENW